MQSQTLKPPLKSLNRKLQYWLATSMNDINEIATCCSKWSTPGLSIKRWFMANIIGFLLTSIGLISFIQLNVLIDLLNCLGCAWIALSNIIPSYICSTIITVIGLCLVFVGQTQALKTITEVIKPKGTQKLVDILLSNRRLHRGTKIVALGGGTGLSSLLRGLKQFSHNLTAIVTVADDGGSSGRLRQELGVLPPGDIRNCLAALATEESLLTKLFQYRFSAGDGLKGHSFGNLFLTAMTEITGNFEQAIATSSKVLAVKGQVLPATLNDVSLWAELDEGRIVTGESNIATAKGKINNIGCIPANPKALPATIKAIKSAECIVLGPGSLYTSIIPTLLVPEIRDAIANAKVPRIYVCNIMTQPGETDDYTVADHIRAIDKAGGLKLFDAVIVNQQSLSTQALTKYAQEGSYPVKLDYAEVAMLGRQVISADILDENQKTHYIRHNSHILAKTIAEISTKQKIIFTSETSKVNAFPNKNKKLVVVR